MHFEGNLSNNDEGHLTYVWRSFGQQFWRSFDIRFQAHLGNNLEGHSTYIWVGVLGTNFEAHLTRILKVIWATILKAIILNVTWAAFSTSLTYFLKVIWAMILMDICSKFWRSVGQKCCRPFGIHLKVIWAGILNVHSTNVLKNNLEGHLTYILDVIWAPKLKAIWCGFWRAFGQ